MYNIPKAYERDLNEYYRENEEVETKESYLAHYLEEIIYMFVDEEKQAQAKDLMECVLLEYGLLMYQKSVNDRKLREELESAI